MTEHYRSMQQENRFPDSGLHMSSQLADAQRPHPSSWVSLDKTGRFFIPLTFPIPTSRLWLLSYVHHIKKSVTLHGRLLSLSEHLSTKEERRTMRKNPREYGRESRYVQHGRAIASRLKTSKTVRVDHHLRVNPIPRRQTLPEGCPRRLLKCR